MNVTEINLIVSDLDRSRTFYEAAGCSLREVTDDSGQPTACLSNGGPMPVSLHSEEFAAWWDPTGPRVVPGSTTIDLTGSVAEADRMLEAVPPNGGRILSPPRNMDWGQCYAIFADPDGYRWGIKTEPRPDL